MLIEAPTDQAAMQDGDRVATDGKSRGVKLSDVVYAKIASRIRSGEYAVDSRLPTENDLAQAMGVSRPIVREALARLRNDGVVVSRRGSGTYVRQAESSTPHRLPPLSSIADMRRCLEYRLSLEGECAWHAAAGARADREPLHAAMARLDSDYAEGVLEAVHDYRFHHSVALATGNRFFHETMATMRSTIVTALRITPNFIAARSQERLAILHGEHHAIYAAINADDPDRARAVMRDHLSRAMRRVFDDL